MTNVSKKEMVSVLDIPVKLTVQLIVYHNMVISLTLINVVLVLVTQNNVQLELIVKLGTILIVMTVTVNTGHGKVSVKTTLTTCSRCVHLLAETEIIMLKKIVMLGKMMIVVMITVNSGLIWVNVKQIPTT